MDYLTRESPSWNDQTRLIDAPRCRAGIRGKQARRSELAGWAAYGYCAAHSR